MPATAVLMYAVKLMTSTARAAPICVPNARKPVVMLSSTGEPWFQEGDRWFSSKPVVSGKSIKKE